MKQEFFKHQFVEFMPEELHNGTLYVSVRFATVSHLCACGCGMKVVTPLKPTDWKLIFDGKTLSLDPSIGNWNFPCRSHYWIRNNRVKWAPQWTEEQVERGRIRDLKAKEHYYAASDVQFRDRGQDSDDRSERQLWHRIKKWFS